MTPLQFEAQYAQLWLELEALVHAARSKKRGVAWQAERLCELYRHACEHLALAQSRAYPVFIVERLERLTQEAHPLIYQGQAWAWARLRNLVLLDIPSAVRAHHCYVWIAAVCFYVPLLLAAWICYRDPGFLLHFIGAPQVQHFDAMYGHGEHAIGQWRTADNDWQMFGFYIRHNITISFQCFASGLFAGAGSVMYLIFNGLITGGVAGYLTQRGYSESFYSFVLTHSAFELTAIVLSGAAGLRLGRAVVAPGRASRTQALQLAARDVLPIMYGVMGLLMIAAAIEAFWSSARWIAPSVKYGVGAGTWALVIYYLAWQGRARGQSPGPLGQRV